MTIYFIVAGFDGWTLETTAQVDMGLCWMENGHPYPSYASTCRDNAAGMLDIMRSRYPLDAE